MIDPRKQAFAAYVRRIADAIALKDWKLKVVDHPSPPGSLASIWLAATQNEGQVSLSETFLDHSPEEQRHTLVHELIHCHHEKMWATMRPFLPSNEAAEVLRVQMEYTVDALADGFAHLLPLPDAKQEDPTT